MLESLEMIFDRLITELDRRQYRFLYRTFNLENRLVGLIGARGVGKTTLMLQYIKEHYPKRSNVFYFSADHIYFKSNTIYAFIEKLYLEKAIDTIFIDEIHKYENWSQELKNLYDGFPSMKLIFSGSSSLDLVKGSYDLTRRAKLYYLPGLSFREYLNFTQKNNYATYSFSELIGNHIQITRNLLKLPGILGHFHDYLKQGFYPFSKEDPLSYYEKLLLVVEKTIYEDVANYYNLRTANLRYLSKILNYLASTPPGKISNYSIGKNLNIDDKTAGYYLSILNQTGLVERISPMEPGNQGLRKFEKIFLNNTNLYYALNNFSINQLEIGTIRELAFIQAIRNAQLAVFYSQQGDYQIQDFTFEIGGKNKTKKQIKNIKQAFLVKDDTLAATLEVIPLFLFGFLY